MLVNCLHYHQVLPEDMNLNSTSTIPLVCREGIFSCHVVNAWNNLPPCIVELSSLNNFKANLDTYWTDNMYIFV